MAYSKSAKALPSLGIMGGVGGRIPPTRANPLGSRGGLIPPRGKFGPAASRPPDYAQQAITASNEARDKQEASKESALGYFKSAQEGLSGLDPNIISPEQKELLMGRRRAELGAYGQNLASQYGDSASGVQSGQRRAIGMGIAGRQANLPIDTELQVGQANRASALGLYSAQANVASQMGGVQTAYQYDPGLEYIKSLGQIQGYTGQTGLQQPAQFRMQPQDVADPFAKHKAIAAGADGGPGFFNVGSTSGDITNYRVGPR